MARLFAMSDLHVDAPGNRALLDGLVERLDDIVLVAGDVADDFDEIVRALDILRSRFGLVIWAPGNHELLTARPDVDARAAPERYADLVAWCRERGVVTPECPFPLWTWGDEEFTIAPIFTLYDYTFRPPRLSCEQAMRIANAGGGMCSDAWLLRTEPYSEPAEWCDQRVEATRVRLAALPSGSRSVLVGHFPLRYELAQQHHLPLFSMWCGTRRTETWHIDFRAAAVVSGHLHRPGTTVIDDVPFTNVSVGLARERGDRPPQMAQILPGEVPLLVPIGA